MWVNRRMFLGLCGAGAGTTLLLDTVRLTAVRSVRDVYAGSPLLRAMRDRAETGVASHPAIRHLLSHEERIVFASAFLQVPGGVEEIHRVIGRCPDYDAATTDRYIERLRRNEVPPC